MTSSGRGVEVHPGLLYAESTSDASPPPGAAQEPAPTLWNSLALRTPETRNDSVLLREEDVPDASGPRPAAPTPPQPNPEDQREAAIHDLQLQVEHLEKQRRELLLIQGTSAALSTENPIEKLFAVDAALLRQLRKLTRQIDEHLLATPVLSTPSGPEADESSASDQATPALPSELAARWLPALKRARTLLRAVLRGQLAQAQADLAVPDNTDRTRLGADIDADEATEQFRSTFLVAARIHMTVGQGNIAGAYQLLEELGARDQVDTLQVLLRYRASTLRAMLGILSPGPERRSIEEPLIVGTPGSRALRALVSVTLNPDLTTNTDAEHISPEARAELPESRRALGRGWLNRGTSPDPADPQWIAMVDAIRRNRRAIAVHRGLRAAGVGHTYGGRPATKEERPEALRAAAPAAKIPARIHHLQNLLYDHFVGKEGGIMSVATFDGTLTIGPGIASTGNLRGVFRDIFARSPESLAGLLEVGFTVSYGTYMAVDTATRTIVQGQQALEIARQDLGILSKIIELGQDPENTLKWNEAIWTSIAATSANVPVWMAEDERWTDALVLLASHFGHWKGLVLGAYEPLQGTGPSAIAIVRFIASLMSLTIKHPELPSSTFVTYPRNTPTFHYILNQAHSPAIVRDRVVISAATDFSAFANGVLLPAEDYGNRLLTGQRYTLVRAAEDR